MNYEDFLKNELDKEMVRIIVICYNEYIRYAGEYPCYFIYINNKDNIEKLAKKHVTSYADFAVRTTRYSFHDEYVMYDSINKNFHSFNDKEVRQYIEGKYLYRRLLECIKDEKTDFFKKVNEMYKQKYNIAY